jgi:hypothetical protein
MAIRKEILESLESKLIRHGYSYVGNDLLAEVIGWIEKHELFKDFPIVVGDNDGIQTKVTLQGWYEKR